MANEQKVTLAQYDRDMAQKIRECEELRDALVGLLKEWQERFHEEACYAGEYDHGIPIKPRRWCDLCTRTNEARAAFDEPPQEKP